MFATYEHFSRIAPRYSQLRTTDAAPVLYALTRMQGPAIIHSADVGCGSGRYGKILFSHLKNRLRLVCLDENQAMLKELRRNLRARAQQLHVVCSQARDLPLPAKSLDCMFTFNAIHHFKTQAFLREAARILKAKGVLFIYTRSRSQNGRNIWGRYFPQFHDKENRLYELEELLALLAGTAGLSVEAISTFKYRRTATLQQLLSRAHNRHYSTFDLYAEQEFRAAVRKFAQNIKVKYENPNAVTWTDENFMLVVRKSE